MCFVYLIGNNQLALEGGDLHQIGRRFVAEPDS
jgi:hypothetical protein